MTNWKIGSKLIEHGWSLKNPRSFQRNKSDGYFDKDTGVYHDTYVKQGSEYVSNDRMENE